MRDKLNRFLFVCSTKNPNCWYLPQGGIDDGESVESAFFREIKEELGVSRESLGAPVYLGMNDVDAEAERKDKRGFSHGKRLFFFLSDYIGPDRQFKIDKKENIEYRWVPVEKISDILSLTRSEKRSLIIKYLSSL